MLAILLLLSASTASARWLEDQARRVISGSRSIAFDNTTLFTPDASGYYTTQYTRDFYYALSGGCWRGSECVERWVQGLPL